MEGLQIGIAFLESTLPVEVLGLKMYVSFVLVISHLSDFFPKEIIT